jgi:hypothetical protein
VWVALENAGGSEVGTDLWSSPQRTADGEHGQMLTIFQRLRDINREGKYEGLHTEIVTNGLRQAIILFIISENFLYLVFLRMLLQKFMSHD